MTAPAELQTVVPHCRVERSATCHSAASVHRYHAWALWRAQYTRAQTIPAPTANALRCGRCRSTAREHPSQRSQLPRPTRARAAPHTTRPALVQQWTTATMRRQALYHLLVPAQSNMALTVVHHVVKIDTFIASFFMFSTWGQTSHKVHIAKRSASIDQHTNKVGKN